MIHRTNSVPNVEWRYLVSKNTSQSLKSLKTSAAISYIVSLLVVLPLPTKTTTQAIEWEIYSASRVNQDALSCCYIDYARRPKHSMTGVDYQYAQSRDLNPFIDITSYER